MAILNPEMQLTSGVQGMVASDRGEMLGPGQFLYLKNVRAATPTTLQARPGYNVLNLTALPQLNIHSIRRLNDYIINSSVIIVGAGTAVFTGLSSFASTLTGFSGDPLTMVPSQPNQSPAPWMYIGDRTRMGKIGFVGGVVTGYNHGIATPNIPASYVMQGQPIKEIDLFESTVGWTAATGAISNPDRINTTITAIKYDAGTTGYAFVVPAVYNQNIQPGAVVLVAGVESVKIHSVYSAIANTTIAAIAYDSGSTGLCSLVLTKTSDYIKQDSVLLINSGGGTQEYVRVLSVIEGPDGTRSLRLSTVNTHAAGEAVNGVNAFRAFFTTTRAAADTLVSKVLQDVVGAAGIETLTKTSALDLSNVGNRAVQDEDDIHISINTSALSSITEIQVQLDVDGSVNDFTRNYFFYSIRANDLLPAAKQTLTTLTTQQRAVQRTQIEESYYVPYDKGTMDPTNYNYGGVVPDLSIPYDQPAPYIPPAPEAIPTQTALGDNQWTELTFKVKDLIRVGSDETRTLKDVAVIRLSFNLSAATTILVDSWWIGGTYGPDARPSGFGYLYFYRYRGRAAGGSKSNPSPVPRSEAIALREAVVISGPTSADPQVDTVDIFRQGGTLSTPQYVGSVPNTGGTWSFTDTFGDGQIVQNPLLEIDNYQPFPTTDLPRSGICSVVGTTVTSAAAFNTSWGRGSIIVINGVPTRLYAQPTSTSFLEITENLGNLTNVTFELANATLIGTPLPVLIGPYTNGGPEHLFALGDGTGDLYWTKANEPDSAPDTNFLHVTSPSEPLVSGVMYDGKVLIWSTERMFFVVPDGSGGFQVQEIANSKGLQNRWACCVGQLVYFLGKDGIYESEGGQPRLISGPLFPLFPNEVKSSAEPINDYLLPISYANTSDLRLYTYGNYMYFTYKDTDSQRKTLVWDIRRRAWISDDVYDIPMQCYYGAEGRDIHTVLMGGNDGHLYELGENINDGGNDIIGQIVTGVKFFEWWRHHRSFHLAVDSPYDCTLQLILDGTTESYPVVTVGPTFSNKYFATRSTQTKSAQIQLNFIQQFKLYLKDCAMEVKDWPFDQGYTKYNPFA